MDLGDGKSSSSESTKSDEVTKKKKEVENGESSSKLISHALKNPFSSTVMTITLVKKKMFSIESLGWPPKRYALILG